MKVALLIIITALVLGVAGAIKTNAPKTCGDYKFCMFFPQTNRVWYRVPGEFRIEQVQLTMPDPGELDPFLTY